MHFEAFFGLLLAAFVVEDTICDSFNGLRYCCDNDRLGGRAPWLGQTKGPSAAARSGLGARRCRSRTRYINVIHTRSMYKLKGRGGGEAEKSFIRK